jgi:hypothetical protein
MSDEPPAGVRTGVKAFALITTETLSRGAKEGYNHAPGEICDQPPMRAVPEWPSFLTHRTVEPLRVSL